MTRWKLALFLMLALAPCRAQTQLRRDYRFKDSISRPVLEAYLSRAVTMTGLSESETFPDDRKMLKTIGAKFIGRAAFLWGQPVAGERDAWQRAQRVADSLHADDPECIVQAAIFEAVYDGVNTIDIPEWAFVESGMTVEKRNFRYQDMLFDKGHLRDHWQPGGSVPDITKPETRLWFYYRARRYIDAGYEAIHWGQIHLTGERDPDLRCWQDLFQRVRRYADAHARRHYALFDGHITLAKRLPIDNDGRLLLDFLSYPLRPVEIAGRPQRAQLALYHADTLYGRTPGGIHPSGWRCEQSPYLVEFDQCGVSGKEGREGVGIPYVWGYEEAAWFANQPEAYRNIWLRYATEWLQQNDRNGHLEMPGRIPLSLAIRGERWYRANEDAHGFAQAAAIQALWAGGR